MTKTMTSQEMIVFADKQRNILRKYRCVPCANKNADSKLYHPPDARGESDLCLDKAGSELLDKLKQKFYQFEDEYYGERLLNLLGNELIDNQIYSFIRKKKFVKNIPHDLLRPKRHKWVVFVGLSNIHVKNKIDFKVGILHPPGLYGVNGFTNKMRENSKDFFQTVFLEVRNIEAPTLLYASIKAIEHARTYLAMIPNPFASLSYRDDIRFAGSFLGHNRNTNEWCWEWRTPHKGIVISDHEHGILKEMGELIKEQTKKKSNLSKRVSGIAEMLFTAKATQYPPAKLLLLATVLESLLLEETFNRTAEYKKQNKMADRIGNPKVKVKKGTYFYRRLNAFMVKKFNMKNLATRNALKFLNELYDMRSEVTHLCEKHQLSDNQVQLVESLCLVLIKALCKAKARTHLAALRKVGAVQGKI